MRRFSPRVAAEVISLPSRVRATESRSTPEPVPSLKTAEMFGRRSAMRSEELGEKPVILGAVESTAIVVADWMRVSRPFTVRRPIAVVPAESAVLL